VVAPIVDFSFNLREIMNSKNIKYSRSTEKVYLALKRNAKPLKSLELAVMTDLTDRTVRTALRKLYEANLIKRVPCFNDMRSHFHVAL
jgi:DNA-binding MarR family transcriptional regulator